MEQIFIRHRSFWKEQALVTSVVWGFILLGASLLINYYAGVFATEHASNAVTDIVLSNIPVYDVDGFFIYGTFIFWLFVTVLVAMDPRRLAFLVKSVALLVLIRSLFISLTHIGPFPGQITIDSRVLNKFTFGGDLFFSGHVGLAFLMTLIFWGDTRLRCIFFASAIFFGIIVLMGHVHYSIDVLSAFFITYTIFALAQGLFTKDYQVLKNSYL